MVLGMNCPNRFENNDDASLRKIVSTSYFLMFLIGTFFLLVFVVFEYLHGDHVLEKYLSVDSTVFFAFVFFMLFNMLFGVIKAIFFSQHKSDVVSFIQFAHNVLFVLVLFNIVSLGNDSFSLISVVILNGCSLLLVQLLISVFFFKNNAKFRPSLSAIDLSYIRRLTSVGGAFFVIQFSALVLLTTDRILILNLTSAEDAARYDLLFRLFNIFNVIAGVFLLPMWAAFASATHNKNYKWIRQKLNLLVLSFVGVLVAVSALTFFAEFILAVWVNDSVEYRSIEIWGVAALVLSLYWTSIFSTFCNGSGLLKVQAWCSILAAAINIPLSIFLVESFGLGMEGVIAATIVGLAFFGIGGPINSYFWLKKTYVEF